MLYLQYKYQSFIQKHYENRTPAFASTSTAIFWTPNLPCVLWKSDAQTYFYLHGPDDPHTPPWLLCGTRRSVHRRAPPLHRPQARRAQENIHQLVDAGFFDKEMYLNHNILTTRNLQMGYRRRKNAMPIPEQYRIVTATERRREERAERRREKAIIRKEEAATEKIRDKESSTDTPTILAQNLLKV